jgi:hypothetical protein
MRRVLVRGRAAIVVVGSSTIRGVNTNSPKVVAELGESVGFKVAGISTREIVRDARMMPASNAKQSSGIQARMHEEGVVGFVKR